MQALAALGPTAQTIGLIVGFLLLLSFMVFFHELGHFLMAKRAGVRVEEFGIGFPPRIWSTRRGETEYTINALPLGGFCRMSGENGDGQPSDPRSFGNASKLWRFGILFAGPAMNVLLAIVIFAAAYAAGWPTVTRSEVQVQSVVTGLPADSAGLKPNDVVVSIAGQPVPKMTDLRRVAEENRGRDVPITVRRDGSNVDLTIRPRESWPAGEGPLGIGIADRPTKIEPVAYPIGESIVRGAERTAVVAVATFYLPIEAIRGQLPWSMIRPSGPVGIYQITSQAAVESIENGWWFPILSVAAMLSVGLGVANLLPIPGLDGGRLVFLAVEAIRRRRLKPETEAMINVVGLAVLFSLVILITFFDISSPVSIDWASP
jgi:regulator of sigma E protease